MNTGSNARMGFSSRPTFLGIFLAVNLMQVGGWLMLNSAFKLNEQVREVTSFMEALQELIITRETDPDKRQKMKDTFQDKLDKLKTEFGADKLSGELRGWYQFTDRKIHHVLAVSAGALAFLAGSLFSLMSIWSWRKSSGRAVVGKAGYIPALGSRWAAWFSFLWGLIVVVTALVALNRLAFIRDTASARALFHSNTMLHLKYEYLTAVMVGGTFLLVGILSILANFIALQRAAGGGRKPEKSPAESKDNTGR